jgi:hypothetical protein
MRIREIYKPKPKGIRYTIYRGEKPAAFHDSGIPMGTEMPRKAFMHGVPSKLINHIMDKLAAEVPSEKFYTELEEGLPAKIATAAGISLAGDIVAKGIKKIAKKIKDDPKDADEELEEAPMGPIAKGLATAAATASMAGAVSADPGSDEKYDNREPGTPEYNAPATGNDYVKPEFDQDRAETIAYQIIHGLGYDTRSKNAPRGYEAFVQDVGNYSIEVKVYYKGTLGFRDNATVTLHMDMKGRIDDISVYADGKFIEDHPEFKNVIGSRIGSIQYKR